LNLIYACNVEETCVGSSEVTIK